MREGACVTASAATLLEKLAWRSVAVAHAGMIIWMDGIEGGQI